ncbi:MAG: hypothetical protein J5I50_02615 [Chitinophagaceae bacterium]|nr:hypothetical protein [Chitinophagaceae bacterium]
MRLFTLPLFIVLLIPFSQVKAQTVVSGTVFDSTRLHVVQDVLVLTTGGEMTRTDSSGSYKITMNDNDSLYFFFAGKNTLKYALNQISFPDEFDISLHVKSNSAYKVLQEVVVFSDTYRFDSLENRKRYAKIFGDDKRKLETSISPDGNVGLDIGSIVELFQFRKNKQRSSFQQRLIRQEEEGYVDYRFNARLISRMTGLTGNHLENYRKLFRPSYEFVSESSLEEFYNYILETSYDYKKAYGIPK